MTKESEPVTGPMKNPPHPGRALKGDFEALGLSIAEAAQALGISRSQLHRVTRGENAILECYRGRKRSCGPFAVPPAIFSI